MKHHLLDWTRAGSFFKTSFSFSEKLKKKRNEALLAPWHALGHFSHRTAISIAYFETE
jgi:hypothetical protein